jgi:hypothetical protein
MSDHKSDNIIKEVLSDQKLYALLEHPLFLQTIAHEAKGSFVVEGVRYAYWANNLCPDKHDGKTVFSSEQPGKKVYFDEVHKRFIDEKHDTLLDQDPASYKQIFRHHGHENIREFGDNIPRKYPEIDRTSSDDQTGIMVLNNFETQTGDKKEKKILDLAEIEQDPSLSPQVKELLCASQSFLYAKAGRGNIVTSVQGASPHSFFRTTEIFAIMNNPNITGMQILSENKEEARISPDGIGTRTLSAPVDKKTGYHMLRDEWVESAVAKYDIATKNLLSAQKSEITKFTELFISAREELIKEQEIAKCMSVQTHPFTKKNLYDKNLSPQYDDADKTKESGRIANIQKILDSTPSALMSQIDANASDAKIKGFVDNLLNDKMHDVDKILFTVTQITSQMNTEHAKDQKRIAAAIVHCREYADQSIGDSVNEQQAKQRRGSEGTVLQRALAGAAANSSTAAPVTPQRRHSSTTIGM